APASRGGPRAGAERARRRDGNGEPGPPGGRGGRRRRRTRPDARAVRGRTPARRVAWSRGRVDRGRRRGAAVRRRGVRPGPVGVRGAVRAAPRGRRCGARPRLQARRRRRPVQLDARGHGRGAVGDPERLPAAGAGLCVAAVALGRRGPRPRGLRGHGRRAGARARVHTVPFRLRGPVRRVLRDELRSDGQGARAPHRGGALGRLPRRDRRDARPAERRLRRHPVGRGRVPRRRGAETAVVGAPAIVAVGSGPEGLDAAEPQLRERYAQRYRIECVRDPDRGLALLEAMADDGVDVAPLLVTPVALRASDWALLDRVRQHHPQAKRALLVPPNAWTNEATAGAIRTTMALGRVDHFVYEPRPPSDEVFHEAVGSFLLEW